MTRKIYCISCAFLLLVVCLLSAHTARSEAEFSIRGTLPWHNFLSGPSAWNFEEYREYLDGLADRGLNFVGFHCYTGGSERYVNYVEPLIRVPYRRVLPAAEFDTSVTSRWGYWPRPTDRFLFGTDRLFPHKIFGADNALRARSQEDRYRGAQTLMQRVIEYAHRKGIRVCLGFEFGIYPPEFFSVMPPEALLTRPYLPDPTHPANKEILRLYIQDLKTTYPDLDYVWFWLQEINSPGEKLQLTASFQSYFDAHREVFSDLDDPVRVFNGVWSLAYIEEAHELLKEAFPAARMAISGWGGGNQLPPLLSGLNRALPRDIIFSCLNPGQGWEPQEAVMGEMPEREVWIIPWLEGDQRLWHPQPRVSLLAEHIRLAREQAVDGVIGIHWRTRDIAMNFDALGRLTQEESPRDETAWTAEFYNEWCAKEYGTEHAAQIAPLLVRMDIEQILAPKDGGVSSPEYFPYEPSWGRLSADTRAFVTDFMRVAAEAGKREKNRRFRDNLETLEDTLRFVLLLDETGRQLQPAYEFKQTLFVNSMSPAERERAREEARRALEQAPLRELFETYARRVRSQGELGVLSSLNQKLGSFVEDLRETLEGQLIIKN